MWLYGLRTLALLLCRKISAGGSSAAVIAACAAHVASASTPCCWADRQYGWQGASTSLWQPVRRSQARHQDSSARRSKTDMHWHLHRYLQQQSARQSHCLSHAHLWRVSTALSKRQSGRWHQGTSCAAREQGQLPASDVQVCPLGAAGRNPKQQ